MLPEIFFRQGCGNRFLWDNEPITYKPWDEEKFFFANGVDDERADFLKTVTSDLKALEKMKLQTSIMVDGHDWFVWADGLRKWAYENTSIHPMESEYAMKQILN